MAKLSSVFGALLTSLALWGCPKKAEKAPAANSGPIEQEAPMQLSKPDMARVQLDLAKLRSALEKHKALEGGQYPGSLSELNVKLSFPADITYDSSTGAVKSRAYPAL